MIVKIILFFLLILLISNRTESFSNIKNCCVIEKKYTPNFHYEYTKLTNNKCNLNNDNNKQIMIEGVNNWNNDNCKKNYLGSCRNINKECVDFVDKNFCDKYKMTWSNLTCNDSLPYVWNDRLKMNVNLSKNDDGSFKMF